MRAFVRAMGSLASSRGANGRLLILFYHRVHKQFDALRPGDVDAGTFSWQMQLLSHCFTPLHLDDAIARLKAGELPANAVCVTFDDGYADNAEVALPILKQWDVPATFFLATGYLGSGCMWNDRVIEILRRVPGPTLELTDLNLGEYEVSSDEKRLEAVNSVLRKLKYFHFQERTKQIDRMEETLGISASYAPMMNHNQVLELVQAGMGIGAHTINHPILSKISLQEAQREIEEGKQYLEKLFGLKVTLFAYPNGVPETDYMAEHVCMVKEAGFDAAVSTSWAAAQRSDDFLQLPRIAPWDSSALRFYLRMIRSYRGPEATRV